jgi:uncharacterized membrane protein
MRFDGLARALAVAIIGLTVVLAPPGVRAQQEVSVTTPFPSVSVQPGASVSFDLTVGAAEAGRVALALEGVPEGWTATMRGGGYEVQAVYATPDTPATVTLDVQVPDDASEGTVPITVTASAGEATAQLPLELNVLAAAGGTVELVADFPALRGTAEQSFEFSLELSNDTPQALTFSLQATGPRGWDVAVQPAGQETAASVTVDARGSQRLTVTATPSPETATDLYAIVVDAVSGDQAARAELAIEVTGRVQMTLTTPDQRLNTTATAGSARTVDVVVVNEGPAPLTNVQMAADTPSDWSVTFEPATLEQVAPGETAIATATLTPSGSAVAGDYVVTVRAQTEDANETLDMRVTVETPPIWGIVGLALIALAIGGLVYVFRRYGRR